MAGAIFMFGPSPYPAWTGPVAVAVDGAPAEPVYGVALRGTRNRSIQSLGFLR